MSAAFPPIAALLPHAGPMLLVDRVLDHDAARTHCAVDPGASRLFQDADRRVPAWLAIEYMAQCAAAHGGLAARARGEPPRPGLFLGSRHLVFRCDAFEPGRELRVTARHVAGRGERLAFDCAVHDEDGQELAAGRLNVLVLRDLPAPRGAAGRGPSTDRRRPERGPGTDRR
jgi:predicted hotdog family 3-hydroxylacyl-ACP dehydratase